MEQIRIISAARPRLSAWLGRIWQYRSLILTFTVRDIRVKYAQTFLGVFWVLLQPLPSVFIFTFLFGRLIRVNTGILPYPLFALTGMIGWNYFTNLTGGIGGVLIESQHILKKVYFPKIILPLSKTLAGAVDFLVSFLLIIAGMLLYHIQPSWAICLFPCFFILNVLTGFAFGIWISALTFRYRDLQHVAPYFINFSIWLTPVFYPTTILPPDANHLMYLNPMAFVIEGYRYALTGVSPPSMNYMVSVIPVFVLLVLGLQYFRRIEDRIAEFI